jgi:hypothetical protein
VAVYSHPRRSRLFLLGQTATRPRRPSMPAPLPQPDIRRAQERGLTSPIGLQKGSSPDGGDGEGGSGSAAVEPGLPQVDAPTLNGPRHLPCYNCLVDEIRSVTEANDKF